MPDNDKFLGKTFIGKKTDTEKMRSQEWHDQGSSNYHFGLPTGVGLWAKRLLPASQCCCNTIWLFVFLELDDNSVITQTHSSVHNVFNDGSFDLLYAPFAPDDYKQALNIVESILAE